QERALKFVRRNQLLVGAASAIFLLMLIGIISTSAQASRARKAEADARQRQTEAEQRLAEVYATTAASLIRRGRHVEALDYYQKALDEGHPQSLRIRLDMARANAAIYKPEETRKILDDLLREPDLGEHEGS